MTLSEAQRRVLSQIVKGQTHPTIPYRTADSLRKLGLVDRETVEVIKRTYATADGEMLQFEVPPHNPIVWHEWFPTPAGRAALGEKDSE